MSLTKKTIDKMVYSKSPKNKNGKFTYPQDIRWDNDPPGFGIRIYPTGKKSFIVFYRVKGRQRIMTIGSYGKFTVDEARVKAKKYLVAAIDGDDPLELRQAEKRGETVNDLCEAYMERHSKPHKKSWKDDQRCINKYILPAWKNLKAKSIKQSDVAFLHSKIGKKHLYAANRTIELISGIFTQAKVWGYVDREFPNPAEGVKRFREKKRDRWITPEELPKLAEAIDQEPNVHARNALWLYLLTGLRKSELLNAKWSDVDWDRKELKVIENKSGRPHYAPLSEPAIALLRDIPKLEGNPHIIVGLSKNRPLVNLDKPWRRVRKHATVKLWADHSNKEVSNLVLELREKLERDPTYEEVTKAAEFELPPGIEDVRLHDLRRTVGSWLAQSGNSLHLIGRVLNHSDQKTTAVYARFGQDQVRTALEQHGNRLMGIAKKKSSAEVAQLKEKVS